MTASGCPVANRDTLIAEAKTATGLSDFGDPWVLDNLAKLIPSLNTEARLTQEGALGANATIVNALSNRLRHVDLVKRHPEIREEELDVAAVVVGLPRTGSTMMHRLLASAPGMTGPRWFETHNYAPMPGEKHGEFHLRKEYGQALLDHMVATIPDLMSIHPMSLEQYDEELIIQGQLFCGTWVEGMYFVPSYAEWMTKGAQQRSYPDLKEILQSLQWQDPTRKGKRWVLKTPGHLLSVDTVAETFPDALIVMTHRDPVQTVPSFVSMEYALYQMCSKIDPQLCSDFWAKRLREWLDLFSEARDRIPQDRFLDVKYVNQVANPIEEGTRVLEAAGVEVTQEIIDGMAQWIEANKREDRAPHKYDMADFGLTREQIEKQFSQYRERYILPSAATQSA